MPNPKSLRPEAISRRRRIYSEQNMEAARIILQHPERHGGEGSATVRWARAVIERDNQQ